MERKGQKQEKKIFATMCSPTGRKEKLETWRYWEIVGALQWMGADRQTAYDAAKWIRQLHPGDSQTIPNGIAIKITSEG